ncbi:MAG: HEPN domain-containing protein [Verrucomicrobia bacterium]|nr:HEPN domain-containing protein [Verrucomicrobiota bacterium]
MDEYRQWLVYAEEDLRYGELGMQSLPRAASWSFQQSAEKALKAALLSFELAVPRTHDVAYLLSLLVPVCTVPEAIVHSVLLISEITPATRYPSDDLYEIDGEQAKEYFAAARHILDWAKNVSAES